MLSPNLWFIVDKNVSKPLLPQPLGQSSSLDQFDFFFRYGDNSNNTLSCSELNGEHAGEGFRSIRHILTPLLACKAKKCHFSRKFDLWPDLTRSNVDLGLKTICAIARSHRNASTGFFREALQPSGADRQGGSYQPPPPPLHWRRWRNTENGPGLRQLTFYLRQVTFILRHVIFDLRRITFILI